MEQVSQQIVSAGAQLRPGSPEAIRNVTDRLGRLATQIHLTACSRQPQRDAIALRIAAVQLAELADALKRWPTPEPAETVIRSVLTEEPQS